MSDTYNMVIDYRRYITEQARDFYGRAKVLTALNKWLVDEGPRFFAIIGSPGSGKTAIAAQIAQFALGQVPAPPDSANLTPNFLSAIHFCPASDLRWTSDRRWFHPKVFAESLGRQLAARYPAFATALVEQASHGRITINSTPTVDQNNGTVIGVNIERLDARGLSIEDAFNYTVREPLETLLRADPTLQVVLLVDALDEAARYEGSPNIVSLITQTGSLSPNVRFIVTARPGVADLEELAAVPSHVVFHRLDDEPYLSESLSDVRGFFLMRARSDRLEERLNGVTLQELADRVSERSEGNFLYATQISQMLHGQAEITHTVLDDLPRGLTAFYRAFLRQTIAQSKLSWATRLQPALGTVAVAQEALRRAPLAAVVRQTEPKMIPILKSVRPVLDQDDSLSESRRTYSFYHRSFADFLLDQDDAGDYWCEAAEQHERMARYYRERLDDDADPYGRRYISLHLTGAALGRNQPARHKHTAALIGLMRNLGFEQLRVRLDGPTALRDDLERALRAAAVDNHPDAPPLVLAAAAKWLAFKADYLTPEPIFKLASAGRVHDAARLLALLPVESKWQQVALLSIVWLGVGSDSSQAKSAVVADAEALLASVAESPFIPPPVPELLEIVSAALHGTRPPALPLPPAPDPNTARDMVTRSGGGGIEPLNVTERVSEYVYSGFNPYSHVIAIAAGERRDSDSIFIAAQDGPLLVAYAAEQAQGRVPREPNDDYIDQYIALQAANNYIRYRNGSLWALLDAVLRYPDPNWVRERVVQLVGGALAGSRIDYQEGVPLTLLALRARAGERNAERQFERIVLQAEAAAAELTPTRGRNDVMGTHTRRLGVLAQLHATVLGHSERATAMLDQVLAPDRYGYAGLYVPAALTLAEAIQICQPGDRTQIDQALEKARRSAHRVQDSPFCAQTTARWNALFHRWWSRPLGAAELEQTVRDLHANPAHMRFTALHRRGEAYDERPRHDPDQLPIASWVFDARTLAELAEVYERPLAEFERVNPGDDGVRAEVNVPDPTFPPLLAAYLSAEVVADPMLLPARKAELIQLLVPIAAQNPTALDTVLARLLIAADHAGWIGKSALKQFEEGGYPGALPVFKSRV